MAKKKKPPKNLRKWTEEDWDNHGTVWLETKSIFMSLWDIAKFIWIVGLLIWIITTRAIMLIWIPIIWAIWEAGKKPTRQ